MEEYLQYWLIFKKRWLPMSLVFLIVLVFGIFKTLKEKLIYQVTGQILLKKSITPSLTGIQQDLVKESSFSGSSPILTELAMLRSVDLMRKTLKALHAENVDPEVLLKNLVIKNIENTDVIEISYSSTESKTPALIVNTLMKMYVENDIEANRAQSKSAINFISRQLPLQKARLEKAEKQLQYFKQTNKVLDSGTEAVSTQSAIQELKKDLAKSESELFSLNGQIKSIQEMLGIKSPSQAITASFLSESPSTRLVLQKLQDIQEKIKIFGVSLTENHPTMINMKKQEAILQEELKKRIKQNIIGEVSVLNNNLTPERILQLKENGLQQQLINKYAQAKLEKLSLELRLKSLNKSIKYYQKRTHTLPSLQLIERQLEREISSDETSYKFLLSKYQELQIAEQLNLSDVKILTLATPPQAPVKGRSTTNIILGFVGGLILAGAVAFLLEKFDKKIKNAKTIKELLDYNILGYIPKFSPESLTAKVIVQHDPNATISEEFRLVETNLRFLNALEQAIRVIVITSPSNQEGKSTIAANLALSISLLKQEVLLVDANFYASNQHEIWDIPNERGLSNFLDNQLDLESIITQVEPNLQVIVAGQLNNNNPAVLLSSSKMTDFIAEVREKYQVVIIDSPPLTTTADATILGKLSNGIVLVVRLEMSRTDSLLVAKDMIEKANQNVLGIVVNYKRLPSNSKNMNKLRKWKFIRK